MRVQWRAGVRKTAALGASALKGRRSRQLADFVNDADVVRANGHDTNDNMRAGDAGNALTVPGLAGAPSKRFQNRAAAQETIGAGTGGYHNVVPLGKLNGSQPPADVGDAQNDNDNASSTTLADLLTLLFRADPGSAVRTPPRA